MGIEVAVALAVVGEVQNSRARRERRRAARIARRRRQLELERIQEANIREFRSTAATLQNIAAQTGQAGSGIQGDLTSLVNQLASNLSFNEQLEDFTRRQERALERANEAQSRGQMFYSFANLAMRIPSGGTGGTTPSGTGVRTVPFAQMAPRGI